MRGWIIHGMNTKMLIEGCGYEVRYLADWDPRVGTDGTYEAHVSL